MRVVYLSRSGSGVEGGTGTRVQAFGTQLVTMYKKPGIDDEAEDDDEDGEPAKKNRVTLVSLSHNTTTTQQPDSHTICWCACI